MRALAFALPVAFLVGLAGPALGQEVTPEGVQVGTALPPLIGVDLDERSLLLSRYYEKGAIVLSFWSLHCGDCIRELDDLRSIRKEFPPEEVTIVAVNTDSGVPVARVADFLRRYERARGEPLGVVHLLDRNASIVDALGVRYIPLLVVADRSGRVTSIVTGYAPEAKSQLATALSEGQLALGAWSEGLKAKLRSVLRSPGVEGRAVEWGSFRVEEGMPLFGLYDGSGWLADAAGRRDRELEARRVEAVVAERLKVALLREALASVGVSLGLPGVEPFAAKGVEVPEAALHGEGRWARLYRDLRFGDLYREQWSRSAWANDEFWAGLVADVDLGTLRERLAALGLPARPASIRLEVVSDFDFKSRAVFKAFERASYRLQGVDGARLAYFGDAPRLAEELGALAIPGMQLFVEVLSSEVVRLEVY